MIFANTEQLRDWVTATVALNADAIGIDHTPELEAWVMKQTTVKMTLVEIITGIHTKDLERMAKCVDILRRDIELSTTMFVVLETVKSGEMTPEDLLTAREKVNLNMVEIQRLVDDLGGL